MYLSGVRNGKETLAGTSGAPDALNGSTGTAEASAKFNGAPQASNGIATNSTGGAHSREDIPIAIVGMALRLPGGIGTTEDLWETFINKKDQRQRVPADRWNTDAFYSKTKQHGSTATQHGYFLDGKDLQGFDTSFFSMTRNELEKMDPQHCLLLQVTRECLENAGEVDWRGKDIGCYVGTFGEDWLDLRAKDNQAVGMYGVTGAADFVMANRISYEYDFQGPSITVKAACASSLICLHMACEAIRSGEITAALVGGANLITSPSMTISMSDQGVLSRDGSCKTFDAAADGYARAEGVNALYVKRLDAALRDGNPIRAIVRATATNSDGKTAGLSHPSTEAHEALIRRTYERAGIRDYGQTAYVECHGTGTTIGDAVETNAVGNVFGERGVYITSSKPNLGHSEGASGITSCIKAVLALENKTIPPNIKFNTPNPQIPFEKAKLRVPVDATPWPHDRHERVSVNAFGIGGSNAHAVIDSAESFGIKQPAPAVASSTGRSPRQKLVVFSANHANSVSEGTKNLQDYLDKHPDSLRDVAHTVGVRRERLPYRSFAVSDGSSPLEFSAPTKTPSSVPVVTFVFTGQGAQWATMGAKLIHDFPSVREELENLDKVLSNLPFPPSWTIVDELCKPNTNSRLDEAEFSQPLCTALQITVVNLLRSWNISPAAVIGHSSGELAAAYASGAITAAEAITAAYYRGLVTKQQARAGAMAAVGLGRKDVAEFLTDAVIIACENSPENTTLSGDADQIDLVVEKIKHSHPNVLARRLRVDKAYHSHHMTAVGAKYQRLLQAHISSSRPAVPFYSTVLADVVTDKGVLDAPYWCQNLESPVLFNTTMAKLLSDRPANNLFLEIGPHSALAGPLRQIFKQHQPEAVYVPTLVRGRDDTASLLTAAGSLFAQGLALDVNAIVGGGTTLTDLPAYPWNHEARVVWDEGRISNEWRLRKFPRHRLLGARVVECSSLEPAWRNMLCLEDVPWIRDHAVNQDIIFPGVAYIAMAGEAIRQVTGTDDFTIRDLTVTAAMILHEPVTTETLFSLRPHRLTTSLDSAWHDFTVSSHNGTSWTKHCSGQVRAGKANDSLLAVSQPPSTALPRKVCRTRWYGAMAKVGLNYGPAFQGLQDISAHPTLHHAVAHVTALPPSPDDEAPHHVHPATTDTVLQLVGAAAWRGQPRDVTQLIMPTSFGEIYMRPLSITDPGHDQILHVTAQSTLTARGGMHGTALAITPSGETVLAIHDMHLAPVGEDTTTTATTTPHNNNTPHINNNTTTTTTTDPHAAARLHWNPALDFTPPQTLLQRRARAEGGRLRERYGALQRLVLLCCVEAVARLERFPEGGVGQPPPPPHMEKFRAWVGGYVRRAGAEAEAAGGVSGGVSDGVEDVGRLLAAVAGGDGEKRWGMICEACEEVRGGGELGAIGEGIMRVVENVEGIYAGETSGLELLMRDEILRKLYDLQIECWDFGGFLGLLSHSKPNLKVLEIGAGTGATTAMVLDGLPADEFGERLLYSYTYTDISAGFFVQAKERFGSVQGIEYAVLDVTQDPAEQGFELGSYDLVVAANVLHATPSLHETLVNIRKLLQPKGKLLLQELCSSTKWINFIMGVLPGWWLGEPDGRPEEPYVSPERWDRELKAAGFAGTEAVVYDEEPPYHTNATIIASPAIEAPKTSKKVSILSGSSSTSVPAAQAAVSLEKQGFTVDFMSLSDAPRPGQDIISVLDLEGKAFLENASSSQFHSLQSFLAKLTSSGMLWLTKAAQIECTEPQYAQIIGLARSVRNELSVDLATIELDNVQNSDTFDRVVDVLVKFQDRSHDLEMEPEWEYAIREGVIHISRFRWVSVWNELASDIDPGAPKMLEIGKRGSLKTLRWVQQPHIQLAGDEVAVEVRAAGMNFKDLLISMGVVDGNMDDGNGLGCECAGLVTQVGPDAAFQIGDRVAVLRSDAYSTVLRTSSALCARIPDGLSFEDAATMPCVYTTVIHGLLDLARIQKGQTVLVQSACGGVGIAAMHVCRMVGASIFATVGTDEKVDYLMRTFDIPRNHIFNSRSASFLPDVMRETGDRGVDVVLNSLSGELLHASWKCVAEFGKMVEIGKRDFIGHGRLAMEAFEANRTFYGVDLTQIVEKRPSMIRKLLERAMEYVRLGVVEPIRPIKLFDAVDVETAMRYMQKGQHMGKLVIKFPTDHSVLSVSRGNNRLRLRPDVSYLLVGGLGGLGRSVSTWMAEHGARHFSYLSRSGGKGPDDVAFVEEMEAAGCTVQITAGSVANRADVQRAVQAATHPIAGVLQMSMVLRDAAFPKMTYDEWQAASLPKVQGTWNLHHALSSHPLNFFVLFSSTSGISGLPGQANYAAANTFLDAFTQYRHSLQLPASVLDISVMEDVGWLTQAPAALEQLRASSMHCLKEQDLLDALELAIARSFPPTHSPTPNSSSSSYHNPSQLTLGLRMTAPITSPTNRGLWKRDPRMAHYRNIERSHNQDPSASSSSANPKLRDFLALATTNPSTLDDPSAVAFLAHEIGATLFGFLMRPVEELDVTMPLARVGVDSLVAIELRNWSRQRLGVELSVLEILAAGSVEELGRVVVGGLRGKGKK